MAKRDEELRETLRNIVRTARLKADAVLRMDGSRTKPVIAKETGIDQGDLSRLVKALRDASLISADEKHPHILISIPPDFFNHLGKRK